MPIVVFASVFANFRFKFSVKVADDKTFRWPLAKVKGDTDRGV